MPLQQSSLITRKQLACISGGTVNKKKCPNFLKLGTPFNYCGQGSFAQKGNRVHHINVKEEMNLPFPDNNKEELIIHKIVTKTYIQGELPKQIQAMKDTPHVVPIFLEPKDQSTKSGADTGKGLTYLGHWKVTNVLRRTKEYYKNKEICARTYFQFDRFDEEFSKYIEYAHDKPISELITMENFAHMETLGDCDDDHSYNNHDNSDDEKSIDTLAHSISTTPNSTARSVSINPQESIEALESLEEAQEEEEEEASEGDYSDYDGSNDEESIHSVEKSVPTTRTASRRSISVSINSQESPEASAFSEETQEEMKQKQIKQEASNGNYGDNDNDGDAKSIDTLEKSMSTIPISTSISVSRNPQELPEVSEVKEQAQEEIKQEVRDDDNNNDEDDEKQESVDTVEESIPFHQVAVDVTNTATPAPETSESNLPDHEVICIDSSSDDEDAKQISGEEDDDDSIIEDVTSAQPNLKREPDFEEEYFLVRFNKDTSDKMVHIAKKQKPTWLDIRNAVNAQLDPRCGSYNFHIPHRNLDVCQRQELKEVKQYMKGGSGTFDDPYEKIVIKKSKKSNLDR
ncbi:hypothetical protein CTEN210_12533 [Chaetoceros tenuissimus]|uniref:Uncharacterized protein n=1 Tax=Chaetoceros tenuissimus TaxID=426638 RepID=A0AAD3H9Y4_9STRA|nr:hypothetical protein CTEN210_12533 [Chaetoceros tenuissimus]